MHQLEGTYRPSRANPSEPKPPGVSRVPTAPKELDRAAKAEWRRLAPLLARLGLLTELDLGMLAGYCAGWSRWCRAEAEIARDGPVVTTPRGFVQKSPWCNIAREAFQTMEKAASHFGMSPGSRAKVTAIPRYQRDEFDELINGPSDAVRSALSRRRRLLSPLVTGDDPAEAFFQ